MSGSAPTSALGHWSERDLPPFAPRSGESLADAVERDLAECVDLHGEFPSIARYAPDVDPASSLDAAQRIVLAAFDAAPRFRLALALGWKQCHPEWAVAIERSMAIAVLSDDEGDSELDVASVRVGAPLDDGTGRYELRGLLGRGATGSVFRAADRTLSQCGAPVEVALKVVPCERSRVDALLREAGAARAISDSGVARVLDAARLDRATLGAPTADRLGIEDAGVAIATELIEGVPLFVWKALHPARTRDDCARLMDRVEQALAACHARGVAHGDLSPANILVEEGGAPRIVDFGHASWTGIASLNGVATLNGTGSLNDVALGSGIASARGAVDDGDVGAESDGRALERQVDRDKARLTGLRIWLVRDLPDQPRRGIRAQTPWTAFGSAAAVAVLALTAWAAWKGAEIWTSRDGTDGRTRAALAEGGQTASAGAFTVIFEDELVGDPDLAAAVRELLESGAVHSLTEQRLQALSRGLRTEAAETAASGTVSRAQQTRLLAGALIALASGEIQWAAPLAVLAARGGDGGTERTFLAQAIADIARCSAGERGNGEIARASIARFDAVSPAPGLTHLCEMILRQTSLGAAGPSGDSRSNSQL